MTDFAVEGMLYASLVRSPVARGELRSLVFPRLPAGYRSILPADVPGKNLLSAFGAEMPVLASSELSYEGEPVAIVAGPDPVLADDLAAATRVICEEGEPFSSWESFSSDQVVAKRVVVVGDPDLAFSIASNVLEETYASRALVHAYSEPQGAAAGYDYDKMAVWCATQWPYHVRDSVALVLGCRNEEVSVRPTRLGIHLDGKLWYPSFLACHAALAAVVCGRPVKLLLTRQEDFLFAPKRARSSIRLRSALDASGGLAALDARIAVNVGAYGPLAEEILSQAVVAATGAYACPNIRIEGYAVATNAPPLGAFGGLGASHSFFAVESHADRIASFLGEDPIDWKSRNALRKGSRLITGEVVAEEVPYEAIASRLAAASDFRRKHAAYELVRKRREPRERPARGIGMAFAYQGAGPFLSGEASNSYALEATLDKDLRVTIRTSAAVGSDGVLDMWRKSASDILGVGPEAVTIVPPLTDEVPNSGPSTLSRNVTVVNRLVERACLAIQKRRFRDPLPLAARSTYRVPKPMRWEEGKVSGHTFDTAAWGGAVIELELDQWSLEPRPLAIWLCVDGGDIAWRERAAASLRSGATDSLGSCLYEFADPEGESAAGGDFFRYSLMPLHEVPPIRVDFVEPPRRSPAKGIGELPFAVVPAAFLAAVSQAAGRPFSSLPVGPIELFGVGGGA